MHRDRYDLGYDSEPERTLLRRRREARRARQAALEQQLNMAAENNDDNFNVENQNRVTIGQYINPTVDSCGSLRAQIDSSAGGSLYTKTVEEAQDLIELVANNQYLYSTPSERSTVKRGAMEAEAIDTLMAQNKVVVQQINLLNRKLGTMQLAAANTQIGTCGLCGNQGHSSDTCALIQDQQATEQMNYMNWRNHSNFGWGGQGNQFNQGQR
ncbi:hypothetical protein PIB30_032357 [Stylosanthes scabra]|uniref:Uncharacterized protein n=1 Tax=Stylosanthes scabra TaxID=79078 RepID=A0ABU6TE12_9FABA|nr:hypothetical protein [Stylosanthes scabra]